MMVSIVMPVYNSATHLSKTLASVEQQTYAQWQLLAIDDGSDDNSNSILQEFQKKHLGKVDIMKSPTLRSGAALCRNIGWKNSKGPLIIFLDSDDLLEPFCLEQRIAVMEKHPKCDWAVFNQYAWFPKAQPPFGYYNKHIENREEAIRHFIAMDSAWQTMAVIWKRGALEILNGFDESLYFMEDPDLHLRALLNDDLIPEFNNKLPADTFYRMPELTISNSDNFYNNSINSRFIFLNKMIQLLDHSQDDSMRIYRQYIRDGFLIFVKAMLAFRLINFQKQFNASLKLLRNKKILKLTDIWKLRFLQKAFLSKSHYVKLLRLKGIAYKLI